MPQKQNLTISLASGQALLNDPCFWVFIKSFLQNVSDSDLVLFSQDMPEEIQAELLEMGVYDIISVPPTELASLYRDRHLAFWRYLNDNGHRYKYILATDSRDVLFQGNPFDWVADWKERYSNICGKHDFLNHFVVLMDEGFKMSQSGFACIEHFEFQRDIPRPYLNEDKSRNVVNGGVFLGTPRAMQDWHFLIWMTCIKTIGRCTDQATVNWLLNYLENDEAYQVSSPIRDHLCLTGEGIKEDVVRPIFKDGKVHNPRDKMYYMIHQWDRIGHLRESALSQYKK